jgi:RNA polymerase sigma-70 factor (ECF subfamily)
MEATMAEVEAYSRLLLGRARAGDRPARGELLAMYRNYLRVLARTQIDNLPRARCDPSDLVQETLLDALKDFPGFAGTTERELTAWLRQILVRNLADQVKHHKAQSRNWQRQESLEALLDRSSQAAQQALTTGILSPSGEASRREQAVLLADALARLPADNREVIVMRNLQALKFDEIAARMGRSPGAVRMLWVRSLEKLHRELESQC